jgi:cyclopropane-fatty-acyl-phospholipid synthase
MKIAIIGSGISSLTSAYYLCQYGVSNEIHIFEKESEIGGHSKSLDNIELGFQVFNKRSYPNFVDLMNELNISFRETDMSFSVKTSKTEYGYKQPAYTLIKNHKFRNMLMQIYNFYNIANEYLSDPIPMTYNQFCIKNNISIELQTDFLKPVICSIWSVGTDNIENVQMKFLLQFMRNHGLLSFQGEQWYILTNGSREYKEKIQNYCIEKMGTSFKIFTNKCVESVEYKVGYVYVDGEPYDKVIIGTPCDIPKQLIQNKTYLQSKILDTFETTQQTIYVHRDVSFMPDDKNYWSSWNFIETSQSKNNPTLTYWMKSIQHADDENMFVSLNPAIEPKNIIHRWNTSHPKFSSDYKKVAQIQGDNNIYIVGAYLGNHFHEDGVNSAIRVVNQILNKSQIPIYSELQVKPNIKDITIEKIFLLIMSNCIKSGHLIIYYNNVKHVFGNTNDKMTYITITHPSAFEQIIMGNDIGLGEAYMQGKLVTDDLTGFLTCIFSNYKNLSGFVMPYFNIIDRAKHIMSNNNLINSKKNIEHHYDISNDFYKKWLDETMTYSSGIFDKDNTDDMRRASIAKYDRIIDTLQITKDDSILEIGCGWGGFIKRCKERTGSKIIGITLSENQYTYCKEMGYEVELIDYRNIKGKFTKIVSIEMIEAVGADNYNTYFNIINNLLEDNGSAMIQAICFTSTERYNASITNTDFIKKYIFPGAQTLCVDIINQHVTGNKMKILDIYEFGLSYAKTLDIWQKNFNKSFDSQYPETFERMWNFYLSFCSAAFTTKLQCVYQIKFEKNK